FRRRLDFGRGVSPAGGPVGSDGRIAPPEGCLRRGPRPPQGRNAGGKETGFFRRFSGRKKTLPSLRKEAQTMNLTHLIFLAAILVGILIITHWAAKTNTTPQQFYIVSGNLTATQNGLAIAGDFISAASFLGITGSIAFYGFDGFLYAVGFLVSYLLLLFFIAEPIRRLGTYTLGDVIAARFPERPIRLMVSLN